MPLLGFLVTISVPRFGTLHKFCLLNDWGRSELRVIEASVSVVNWRVCSCRHPSRYVVPLQVFHPDFWALALCSHPEDELVTVNTPAFAESVTEGDVRWEKAVGDTVTEDEVVCEIETDKTSVQVPSPAAGVIEALLVPDGGKVEGGTPLFKLRKGAGAAKAADAPPPEAPKAEAPITAAPPPPPPPPAPAAAVDPIPTSMPPVPPIPGQAIDTKPVSAVKLTAAPATPAGQTDAATKGARSEHRVKMNRMRLRIAQRLKEAQNTCAMLTTFNEVDMRKTLKDGDNLETKEGDGLGG
ncbi:hypothetical protein JZ751_002826 [Albula glossodonta]|uniref:Dihydrolipoamide acetyltransferase component of pyruvate dehydrogenase complex n=1 Tax=Albula glossodonta TaxID=121402 RepID=A0A8T2N802_9TELE|nr:hypothetical protein JZ751_002826 [Albula glossodonta]